MSITSTGKKKDGLVVYRVRVTKDGKRVERRVAGYAEAKRVEQELLGAPAGLTFEELVKIWMDYRKDSVRPATYQSENYMLNRYILPYFKNQPAELSVQALAKWQSTINGLGLAIKTKKTIFRPFSTMLNYGVRMELIQKNNLHVLGNFRDTGVVVKEKVRYYTVDQFWQFMAALPLKKYCDHRVYSFFLLAFFTGARRGELNALKWTDLSGDVLHIRRSIAQHVNGLPFMETAPKSKNSCRDIRIPQFVLDYLSKWRSLQEAMPGFSEDWRICGGETFIQDCQLIAVDKKTAAKAGLPHITVHEFRHSHASLLINGGVNIKEISRRLGHASVDITWNVYAHLYPSQEEASLQVLNGAQTGQNWGRAFPEA